MDARAANVEQHITVAFRKTDALIGLEPVGDRIDELQLLVEESFRQAAMREPEAWIELGDFKLELDDAGGATEAFASADAHGVPEGAYRAASTIWEWKITRRSAEAVAFAKKAGAAGEYLLGLFAFHGWGVEKSESASRAHHELAAAAGNVDAMFELYAMIGQGIGGVPDEERANDFCERAAEAGHVRAMANLATFYATGRGGKAKTLTLAVRWYDRAARKGHGKAAATLGCMYALGDEIPQDSERAQEYFRLSDGNGFDWRDIADAIGLDPTEWE